MHDVWIMNRINMTGESAYTCYLEVFNDAAPVPLPNFSNVHAAVEWAAAVLVGGYFKISIFICR
jgi:hypothetical protein